MPVDVRRRIVVSCGTASTAARELADARYAAIGVPDGEGGFANFIASGMTAK